MSGENTPNPPTILFVEGKFGQFAWLKEADRRPNKFPEERPMAGRKCHLWSENFEVLGSGSSFYDRATGIAFLCNGKKYDSNHTVWWSPIADLNKQPVELERAK